MTAPSNIVVSVVTADKDPALPKYRISARPTEDTAIVTFNVDPGNAPLRPGAGVRPGVGVQPGSGAFDIGNALVGDIQPGMQPFVGAWLITKGATRKAAPIAGSLGCVCGLHRCGAPGVKPLRITAKRNRSRAADHVAPNLQDSLSFSEFKGSLAEGDNTINIFALVEPEGWT